MVYLPAQAGAQMYIVYLIKSMSSSWFYVGMTSNLPKRVAQHNAGKTRSTKTHIPFELVYSKEFETRIDARDYEKYLKIRSNKEKLLEKLNI